MQEESVGPSLILSNTPPSCCFGSAAPGAVALSLMCEDGGQYVKKGLHTHVFVLFFSSTTISQF